MFELAELAEQLTDRFHCVRSYSRILNFKMKNGKSPTSRRRRLSLSRVASDSLSTARRTGNQIAVTIRNRGTFKQRVVV